MHGIPLRLALLLLLATTSAASARAPQGTADSKEIEGYRLSMEGLKKVAAVNRDVVRAMIEDPALREAVRVRQEIDSLHQKDEPAPADRARLEELMGRLQALERDIDNPLAGDAASLSEMEARIRRYPPIMEALARESMAPREYATFWVAFVQASFAHSFRSAGMLKELPPGVSPDNVRFVAEHAAEIETMRAELEALGVP